MKFQVLSVLKGKRLVEEKEKDFRNVVGFQIAIILNVLVFEGFLKLLEVPHGTTVSQFMFLFLGGLYLFLLWDMLRNFTQNRIIVYLTLSFLLLAYLATLVAANPLFHVLPLFEERMVLLCIHIAFMSIEVTVIYFTLLAIFKEGMTIEGKIWGSACIFLMIGLTFGSFYDIICLIEPGSLGVNLQQGLPNYIECIYYSMSIIGGVDSEYQTAHLLIKKIAIVESVWSNLFIVLLVGRLLSR